MQLTSLSFANNRPIPARYTCEGDGVNPALVIENVPSGTKSLTLIIDDIDAPGGSFIHWFVFDILPEAGIIGEDGIPGRQCINSAGRKGYVGPCPPAGTHRYVFRLYALDAVIGLPDGSRMSNVRVAMQGHVIGESDLTGMYARKVVATVP
jgi:hypothetical protein